MGSTRSECIARDISKCGPCCAIWGTGVLHWQMCSTLMKTNRQADITILMPCILVLRPSEALEDIPNEKHMLPFKQHLFILVRIFAMSRSSTECKMEA